MQLAEFPVPYFNPRSREGSDVQELAFALSNAGISIHAPAKGATGDFVACRRLYLVISIHAPAKGATRCRASAGSFRRDFNPRSREGSDQCSSKPLYRWQLFQSTLPRRERHHTAAGIRRFSAISIYAPAKGATQKRFNLLIHIVDFNPRSREGSDSPASSARTITNSFQSTLPRREPLAKEARSW